ncbi:MAG TPA: glycoside hydrolase family 3 C-terminal domain-containing protein [Bryobacteraceae bacterium]|nr:glycoside hydrolase family 3 C-terminal domain-containing protein [Bryobacteraceae bacterium]
MSAWKAWGAGFACLLATLSGAWAQPAPSINPGGVVNAASSVSGPVAPGSIASVYGSFLLTTPQGAASTPLPVSLGGLSLAFAAVDAPLFFVSGTQVNLQIPWEANGQASLTAELSGQTSAPQTVDIAAFAPGIFTTNAQGTGPGAILDSSYHLVTPSNPAGAGVTVILIYCTGLGAVNNPPPTGAPAPIGSLSQTTTEPTVTIGGAPAQVLWAGLAPGSVGEYQVNALVPANSAAGDAVSLVLSIGGATSNTVQIAVQPPTADQRADYLISQMTQDEKIQLVYGAGGPVNAQVPIPRGAAGYVPGIPRLGIPDLYLADGSVGVGNGVGQATALPSSIASAASWDVNEAYKYGTVIGSELRAYGMNVNLGGNVNLIGREPRDGRTFETKGEDPVLAGKINAAHINAIQAQHVIAGIKHYALNDQETDRFTADVQIDERGMRESDLLAFEIGVKDANVQSVMCSYNLINSVYACENAHTLNDILKGDWAFPGFVMSDWWATHSTVAAALAGLDQEQPNNLYFGTLGQAIAGGQVPQARLDDMVHRILRAMYTAGLFDYPEHLAPIDTATDQAIAQEAEEQGAVLLKNAGGQLPLNAATIKSIAVIGSHADVAVLSGGGSAQVTPTGGPVSVTGSPVYPNPPGWAQVMWDPSSPWQAIQALAPGATVQYNDGSNSAAAASLAGASQVAIVFVSQWTSEGMDLPGLNFTDLTNPSPIDQDGLVAAVAAANPHTIVVMENAGAQVMPWLNSVSAVLETWFPGQRGGQAIANILFGAVNPSGKLPITFPASVNDLPRPTISSGSAPFPVSYFEGFNVGYKWYDAQGLTPLFPFGFGLSYTAFSFSNATVVNNLSASNPNFQVTFTLANTGSVAGAEVAQIYLAFPAAAGESPKRLVGWQKVLLQPGAAQQVTIEVDANDSSHPLSFWSVGQGAWVTQPGTYTVYLGNSSNNAGLITAGTLQL